MSLINHIGVSGGKDSTALLLWAVHESGYPQASLDVTFCDTGNEAEETYAFVRMLSEKVHPITWLKPELDFYALAKKKKRFPSARARFCTQALKLHPTQEHVQKLRAQGHEVRLHSGVRANESDERSKLSEREFDEYFFCEVYRPLLKWTIAQVWDMHRKYGIRPNPLYFAGCKRVGCLPCIMSRKSEIKLMAKKFPERINMIRENEQYEGGMFHSFFARNKVPLSQRTVEITTKDGVKMKVASIDDVVRWSFTARGGIQYELDLPTDEFQFDEDKYLSCSASMGQCE